VLTLIALYIIDFDLSLFTRFPWWQILLRCYPTM
jgi:hypothetical protein